MGSKRGCSHIEVSRKSSATQVGVQPTAPGLLPGWRKIEEEKRERERDIQIELIPGKCSIQTDLYSGV